MYRTLTNSYAYARIEYMCIDRGSGPFVYISKSCLCYYNHCRIDFLIMFNRIRPKSYDRNKHQNDLFHPEKSRISHENFSNFGTFFKLKYPKFPKFFSAVIG